MTQCNSGGGGLLPRRLRGRCCTQSADSPALVDVMLPRRHSLKAQQKQREMTQGNEPSGTVPRKLINFFMTRFGRCRTFFLHYTLRLLSCKYEPLTQGKGPNPNHDGSSTERDVPKQSSHVRVSCTLNFACCTIKGE